MVSMCSEFEKHPCQHNSISTLCNMLWRHLNLIAAAEGLLVPCAATCHHVFPVSQDERVHAGDTEEKTFENTVAAVKQQIKFSPDDVSMIQLHCLRQGTQGVDAVTVLCSFMLDRARSSTNHNSWHCAALVNTKQWYVCSPSRVVRCCAEL